MNILVVLIALETIVSAFVIGYYLWIFSWYKCKVEPEQEPLMKERDSFFRIENYF